MNISKILPIFIILIISSCKKEIDFDVNKSERFVVLNSIITPDSNISIYLTKSLFPNESYFSTTGMPTGKYDNITNAKVSLYDGEAFLTSLTYTSNNRYETDLHPKYNHSYNIKITVEGFPEVKSLTEIPVKISIDSVRFNDTLQNTYYNLKTIIYFFDPPNQQNYYYLVVLYNYYKFNNMNFAGRKMFISNDPVFSDHIDQRQYFIFDDRLFDGQHYGLKIDLTTQTDTFYDTITYRFYLCSLNKDFYQYLNSYNKYVITTDPDHNPFPLTEPVQFYNNVTNGLGIFGGYQIYCDSLNYIP